MPTIEETISTIKDMGFSEAQAKKALNKTGWSGIEAAAEWLLSNPGDDGTEDTPEESTTATDDETASEVPTKKLVLTEEERAQQMKRAEELRIKKRAERVEKEKQEALELEKKRIEDGKAMGSLKQIMADKEIKQIAEDRVREKKATQLAKERVKAQIEQDKKDRQERAARDRGEISSSSSNVVNPTPSTTTNAPVKDYSEAKIQIRQLDGKPIVQTFKAKETLSAVRLYVQLNREDHPGVPPKLMTNFPKKIFQEDDYDTPLDALGLVPSAVLMISQS